MIIKFGLNSIKSHMHIIVTYTQDYLYHFIINLHTNLQTSIEIKCP
jgi:hypothetical protein